MFPTFRENVRIYRCSVIKKSDSRRTPRLDGTYNVPRYREYQSPRMRRLMRDEERQKRVRISRNYGLLLVVAIVASTIITGVAGGNAVIQMQKADTIKKQHAPTTLISEGLQSEINNNFSIFNYNQSYLFINDLRISNLSELGSFYLD